MGLIWTDEYSVDVKELDAHHQKIFNLLNDSLDAVNKNQGLEISHEIIAQLNDYAFYHFKVEEDLFRQKKYPDAAAHIKEHEEFRTHLTKLDELVKKNDEFAGLELVKFLSAWFARHIMTVDKKYIPYLAG